MPEPHDLCTCGHRRKDHPSNGGYCQGALATSGYCACEAFTLISQRTSGGDDNDVNGDPGQRRPGADPVPPLPIIAQWGLGALTPAEQALADLIDREWIASCMAKTGENPGAPAVRAMRDPMNADVVDAFVAEREEGQ